MSLLELVGLPSPFGIALLTFSFILTVAPFFGGKDFGIFKIPELEGSNSWRSRLIGPSLLIFAVGIHLPVFPVSSTGITETRDERVEALGKNDRKQSAAGNDTGIERRDYESPDPKKKRSRSLGGLLDPGVIISRIAQAPRPGDSALSIVAINVGMAGVASHSIDIFVRNEEESSAVIHQGVLEILNWKKLPNAFPEDTGPWMPSTYQYNLICSLEAKICRVAMA